jgi:DNA-binding response OmpR family regulator
MLVVDDEERICRLLGRALRSAGYAVDSATSGGAALRAVQARDYDLVVLDLMLPGVTGSEVLRRILDEQPDRRVLVLSAVSGITARVRCLEAGAVDFLAKPFALPELLARVRSRIKEPAGRQHRTAQPTRPHGLGSSLLWVGDVCLDTRRRTVLVGDEQRPLSDREHALLLHLMQRADEVCTRAELLAEVWGYTFDPGSNLVDVSIGRLRAKLDDQWRIQTVRNVGYCFLTQ